MSGCTTETAAAGQRRGAGSKHTKSSEAETRAALPLTTGHGGAIDLGDGRTLTTERARPSISQEHPDAPAMVTLDRDDIEDVEKALDGLSFIASSLATYADTFEMPPAAVDGLGDLIRAQRNRLHQLLNKAEVRS